MSNHISFYLAAKYDKRTELLPIAALLLFNGHGVRADWLNGSHSESTEEAKAKYAELDLADIEACTHFVLFQLPTHEPEVSTGRQIEYGYALARDKVCIVVGAGESIFYTKARRFPTIIEFLEAFAPDGKL